MAILTEPLQEYTQAQVQEALKMAGIVSGAAVIVHSSLFDLGILKDDNQDFAQTWIDLLLDAVSPHGAIILPAFSYSYCKGKVFDPKKSMSTVSSLANHAILTGQGYRSLDPIFSSVFLTRSQSVSKLICSYSFSNVCLDAEPSVIGLAHQICEQPVIISIRSQYRSPHFTLNHIIDQKLKRPTRFMKRFTGTTMVNGVAEQTECYYYCRLMVNNTATDLKKHAQDPRNKITVPLGAGGITSRLIDEVCAEHAKDIIQDPWHCLVGPALSPELLQKLRAAEQVVDESEIVRTYTHPVKL